MKAELVIPKIISSMIIRESDELAGVAIKSIIKYVDDGVIPDIDGKAAVIFYMAKEVIDNQVSNKSSISEKRKQAGRIGGLASAEKRSKESSNKKNSYKQWSKDQFIESIKPFIMASGDNPNDPKKFNKSMCNEFYRYWSEPMPSGRMRLTSEPSWDTLRRLTAWKKRGFASKEPPQVITNADRGVHIKD